MASDDHDVNLLAAYIEQRLSPVEHARVVGHLASCVECRRALAAYARASAAASDAPGASRPFRAWVGRTNVWLPVAATVVLTTVAMFSVLPLRTDNPKPPLDPAAPPAPSQPAFRSDPQPGPASPPAQPSGIRSGNQPAGTRADDDLSRRRSGERAVDGKLFRLVAGEWVDQTYDPLNALPEVQVRSADERQLLLQRTPALRPFAALGSRVIVVHDGTVYKFGADPLQ